MSRDGLHRLIDPCTEDVKVIQNLLEYLGHFQGNPYHGDSEQFIRDTRTFLRFLEGYYVAQNYSESVSKWTLCLRQILTLLSETIYIQASCDICEVAVTNVVTLPSRVQGQLCDLVTRLDSAREIANILQRASCSVCETNRGGSANGMMALRRNGFSLDAEVTTIVMKARQLQNLLEGCEVLLSSVVQVIEEKVDRGTRFYNSLSFTIGAICAGNFAWNLWQGGSTEELVSHGLWSVCTGFSAVVLQIPRVRLTDVQTQLVLHRKQRSKVKEVTCRWRDVEKLSYANLVKSDVCNLNGLNGKVMEVHTNCDTGR